VADDLGRSVRVVRHLLDSITIRATTWPSGTATTSAGLSDDLEWAAQAPVITSSVATTDGPEPRVCGRVPAERSRDERMRVLSEQGKSIRQIAREVCCDVATVHRGDQW
jgi:hypothetical protein